MPEVNARTRVLQDIAALARQHRLSAAEIAAAIGEPLATTSDSRGRVVLVRVLSLTTLDDSATG